MPDPDDESLIQQLAGLPDEAAVHGFLESHPVLRGRHWVERLSDRVPKLLHASLDHAERLAEAIRWLAESLDDDYCRARSYRSMGHVLLSRGRYPQATLQYDRALELFRMLGNEVELGRTLSSSMQPLVYAGRHDDALSRAEDARRIFQRTGDQVRLARLDGNLANLLYRQERFSDALALYLRARDVFRGQGQHEELAVTLRNLAVCYISMNRFAEALETHREARAWCDAHGLPRLAVEADYNIAYLHYLRGDYTRAISLYRETRAHGEQVGDDYHRTLCDLDQAEMYLELNLIEDGLELAQRAFAGFETLAMGYEAAKALVFVALAASRSGKAFRGLELFERAHEMFVREHNPVWPALIDMYRALVLLAEGRPFEARRLAAQARGQFVERGLAGRAALCEVVMAAADLKAGQLDRARQTCLEACARLPGVEEPALFYQALHLLGRIEEERGSRDMARQAYLQAQAALEDLRGHLGRDELKLGFLKDKLGVYESLVLQGVTGKHGAEDDLATFAQIERAKARSLADLIAFRAPALPVRLPMRSGLVDRLQSLREELNWYYRRIDLAEMREEPGTPDQLVTLRQARRARETELMQTLGELEADQEFVSLQQGRTVSVEAIRSVLPPDGLLLEYYQARDTILVAVLTQERLQILPLTPASRVRHRVTLLQRQLSRLGQGAEYAERRAGALLAEVQQHLRDLYGDLVEPVRAHLQAGHLVVVPHGPLGYVPFHALFDGQAYVTDDYAVSYAPSASVYFLSRTKPRGNGEGSLVLGVTPEATDSVHVVAAALPEARVFVGADATAQRLQEHAPASRFVHVGASATYRQDNPMFSSLQLGDSRLSLFDVYGLDLPVELVTLCGCGPGLDLLGEGDELLGLQRGLLYAGAQSCLVTLWDADSRATSDFMTTFYRRLGGQSDMSVALKDAMRECRESRPHPYYWAPYLLSGNTIST